MGLSRLPTFQNYHRVLSRAAWSPRRAAQMLLTLLVDTFAGVDPFVFAVDERHRSAVVAPRSKPKASTATRSGPRAALAQKFLRMEVTFEEVRAHLDVETQRQWSDKAIARTTPCLLGLFSLVALMAHRLHAAGGLTVAESAWYKKRLPTFSDALAGVRMALWKHMSFSMSHPQTPMLKIPKPLLERLTRTLAYAA